MRVPKLLMTEARNAARVGVWWPDFQRSHRSMIDQAAGYDRIKVGQLEGLLLQLVCCGNCDGMRSV